MWQVGGAMTDDSTNMWIAHADKWRAKADEVDSDTWRLFCWKEVAFGEEMARMCASANDPPEWPNDSDQHALPLSSPGKHRAEQTNHDPDDLWGAQHRSLVQEAHKGLVYAGVCVAAGVFWAWVGGAAVYGIARKTMRGY